MHLQSEWIVIGQEGRQKNEMAGRRRKLSINTETCQRGKGFFFTHFEKNEASKMFQMLDWRLQINILFEYMICRQKKRRKKRKKTV